MRLTRSGRSFRSPALPWVGGLLAFIGSQLMLLLYLWFVSAMMSGDPLPTFYESHREMLFGLPGGHLGVVMPLLWFDTALVAALWWFHRQGQRAGERSRFVLLGVAFILLGVVWSLLVLSDKFPPLQGRWIYRADVGFVAATPS